NRPARGDTIPQGWARAATGLPGDMAGDRSGGEGLPPDPQRYGLRREGRQRGWPEGAPGWPRRPAPPGAPDSPRGVVRLALAVAQHRARGYRIDPEGASRDTDHIPCDRCDRLQE